MTYVYPSYESYNLTNAFVYTNITNEIDWAMQKDISHAKVVEGRKASKNTFFTIIKKTLKNENTLLCEN